MYPEPSQEDKPHQKFASGIAGPFPHIPLMQFIKIEDGEAEFNATCNNNDLTEKEEVIL